MPWFLAAKPGRVGLDALARQLTIRVVISYGVVWFAQKLEVAFDF
jgi:hypothetical protein